MLAEGEELGSNLLRVPQVTLGDPGGLGLLRKKADSWRRPLPADKALCPGQTPGDGCVALAAARSALSRREPHDRPAPAKPIASY